MIKIIQSLMFITLILPSAGCLTENKANKKLIATNDKEILRYLKEVEWPKAYSEQDTLLLDRILGEDFKMIDQAGNWYTKQDELAWIKQHATNHDAFNYEIKRLEILRNGTAIICGTGHILKDSVKSIYQSSNVLIKREGTWKAVLSHVSGYRNID